jgi:hypothetical protein
LPGRSALGDFATPGRIPLENETCGAFEFFRAEEIIALGRLKAEETLGFSPRV